MAKKKVVKKAVEAKHQLFGEMLLADGLITKAQLEEALHKQQTTMGHRQIGKILVRLGYISKSHIPPVLARQLGLELVGRKAMENIPPRIVNRIDGNIATLYRIIPVRGSEKGLVIVMADPSSEIVEKAEKLLADIKIVWAVATYEDISWALLKYYGLKDEDVEKMLESVTKPFFGPICHPSVAKKPPVTNLFLEQRVEELEKIVAEQQKSI